MVGVWGVRIGNDGTVDEAVGGEGEVECGGGGGRRKEGGRDGGWASRARINRRG